MTQGFARDNERPMKIPNHDGIDSKTPTLVLYNALLEQLLLNFLFLRENYDIFNARTTKNGQNGQFGIFLYI